MIQREQVLAELHAKGSRFQAFNDDYEIEAELYAGARRKLALLTRAELEARLASEPTPGAEPTDEFDAAPGLRLPFSERWSNHEEAREWAARALLDHPVFAADGSQIVPDAALSLPVAAVQVAWFDNRHTRDGRYTKDAAFEILTPDELIVTFDGERRVSEQPVNLRRFVREVAAIERWMETISNERPEKVPVAFFDSSLVISFVDRLQEEMRRSYIESLLSLLRASEQTRVPVIGYVDSSHARDLLRMLARVFALAESEKIHDALLLDRGMEWGERTPFFICARGSADRRLPGVLESFEEYRRGIGFVYLKTNAGAPPARLDIPRWVYEAGLLDDVMDLVRAEVIVGNGYPYALAAADAAAVINARDREVFYGLLERFAARERIDLRVSQKARSKSRRR